MGIELKNGYRVKLKNGHVGMFVAEDTLMSIYGRESRLTSSVIFYDGNDMSDNDMDYRITEVYGRSRSSQYWILRKEELLWSYEQSCKHVEMTFAEIEEKLGYKIKIVG